MSEDLRSRIQTEVMLITSFADACRPRFESIVRELNRADPSPDPKAAVKLCVEAVGMVLETQARLARLLAETGTADTHGLRAA